MNAAARHLFIPGARKTSRSETTLRRGRVTKTVAAVDRTCDKTSVHVENNKPT